VGGTLERYGRVDGVVNSTGHLASGEVLELTDGQWHEAFDLVVLNVVRIARLVTPTMVRQGGGAIINVSTFSAFEPSLTFPLSSSLRAALAGFAKLYADRYAADSVRSAAPARISLRIVLGVSPWRPSLHFAPRGF